mgnify:CR=1 FL=1
MTDSTQEKPLDLASRLMKGTAFQELVVSQTEGLMKAQVDMFQSMATIVETWIAHRRESANTALKAFKQMSECENVGTMMHVYAEWLSERAKQIGDEAQALGAKAAELNKVALAAMQEADATLPEAHAPNRENKRAAQSQRAAE